MRKIRLPRGTYEYNPARPLGPKGGFGQVFLGNNADGFALAIKKLHVSAAGAAHRELRIAEELRARAFEHIIPFIDAGQDADSDDYFVVMQKADSSLQGAINHNGAFNALDAASILIQIVNGLAEAGELVHRDLKPDNILLHDSKWKIADFGIARFVEEATSANTLKDCLSPFYAAPEQWKFQRATNATDLYSLGCIAFCLLTGKPPFTSNPSEQHQNSELPEFSCADARLKNLVSMLMRKQPESRPILGRAQELLANIVRSPIQRPAFSELAEAGAKVASEAEKKQLEKQNHEIAQAARLNLAECGRQILTENLERLWGDLHSHAPNAERRGRSRDPLFQCQLGNAVLTVTTPQKIEDGVFRRSGWNVIASSQIIVTQTNPRGEWSSSLLYGHPKDVSQLRWYEMSFWKFKNGPPLPAACGDFDNVDYALAPIMHSLQLAYGPVTIDDEDEPDFHSRWAWLFTKATLGKLSRPAALPINSWPPNLS